MPSRKPFGNLAIPNSFFSNAKQNLRYTKLELATNFTYACTYKGDSFIAMLLIGTSLLRSFFYPLCYAAVLKILTYYAQYYAHVKKLCLKFDCFIRACIAKRLIW